MLDKQEWHEHRRDGVYSTDAPVILGLSRFMSAAELYALKRGEMPERPETGIMELGKLLEPVISTLAQRALSKHFGEPVTLRAVKRTIRHKERPWQRTHLDREIYVWRKVPTGLRLRRARVIVELKSVPYAGARWGGTELGARGLPLEYRAQIQHQLAVTGYSAAYAMVLVAGSDPRLYGPIMPLPSFIEQMTKVEEQFLRDVGEGNPPEVDGSESSERFLRARYPEDDGAEIIATAEIDQLAAEHFDAIAREKAAFTDRRATRVKLEAIMRTASILRGAGYLISWKAHDETRIGWEEIAAIYRETLDALLPALNADPETGYFRATEGILPKVIMPALQSDAGLATIESIYTRTEQRRPFLPQQKKGRNDD